MLKNIISDYDALKTCIPISLISRNKPASEMTEQSYFNISWGGMQSWQIIFLRGVIQRTLFPLVLLVGVLKPLAVQQIEPRLCCLLSLCQLFLERWWGRRRRKRRRETDFTFSSHSYQGQHLKHNSDKERGSVIRLRAHAHRHKRTSLAFLLPIRQRSCMHNPFSPPCWFLSG